jgi:hypothetical protein
MTLCSLWACPKKNSFGDLFFDRRDRIADFLDGCPQNVRRHAKLLAPIADLLDPMFAAEPERRPVS